MSFIMVYITHENEQEARKVTDHLLKERLIACANIFPIKSVYWWQGELADSSEVVSIVKTRNENWGKVKTAVEKMHPYEIPCIIRIEASANEAYERWIRDETQAA